LIANAKPTEIFDQCVDEVVVEFCVRRNDILSDALFGDRPLVPKEHTESKLADHQIPVDEIRRLGLKDHGGGSDVFLLTESGYLMLVRTFRDKMAWKVQEGLVNHYFRSRDQLPSSHLEHISIQIAKGIEHGLSH